MSQRKSPKSVQTGQRDDKLLSRFLALEPRVLLDAAALDTAEKVLVGAALDVAATAESDGNALASVFLDGNVVVSPVSGAGGAREVLFIDAGIENYGALVSGLGAGIEVHVLQSGDWAAQIQSVLGRRDGDVSVIHIVSHGGAGHLTLGGDTVDAGNIDAYARVWSVMQQALTADGDLLVYGCDVAAGDAGAAFVAALADRTGADVAASVDLTGVASLGGDWTLEATAGDVTSGSLYANGAGADFMGILADGWVQDTEISVGTTSVAMTHTSDGRDWKFVSTLSTKVDVYMRTQATGVWTLTQTIANAATEYGFDMAAAGNKLAVSAPAYNWGGGNNLGSVFVYSYNAGAALNARWTTTAVERIDCRVIAGSGQTGVGGGPTDVNAVRGNAERFGYSIDLAYDATAGNNYRLIVGNPNEDWWEYDNDASDWGTNPQEYNVRQDAGAAWIFSATAHGNFGAASTNTIVAQNGGTTGNGYLFGGVVGATYDWDSNNWWFGVGGDGLNAVWFYDAPGAGALVAASPHQAIAWDSAGNNDVSMDDDYMTIANSTGVIGYKLDAASTAYAQIGSSFGGAGAVVAIDDWDQSAAGDTAHGARMIYSGGGVTAIADVTAGGQFVGFATLNAYQEASVAIDRYYSIDMLTTNAATPGGARSYHYNWDPDTVDDAASGNEDANTVYNVVANDTDINITSYGAAGLNVTHGDALVVSAVGTSAFGATVTFAGGNVTYNPTTSTYLQSLAAGQTAVENITVTIGDGQGGATNQVLAVTTTGVNDAPTANAVVALSPYAYQQNGSTAAYDFGAFFDDIDSGDDSQLAPSATALPVGWSAVTDGSYLRVTIPAGYAAGNQTITVRVQDSAGAFSATKNFVISVDNANNAPVVAVPLPDQVALVGYEYSYTVPEASFIDSDPRPYDVLTYTATLSSGAALPAWLTFDSASRTFSGAPAVGDVGSITVRVRATDDALSKGRGANLNAFDDYVLTIVNPAPKTLTAAADGAATNADYGFSCAMSEDGLAMVVGSPGSNTVIPYYWNGTGWTALATITGPVGGAKFGWSVDLSANGLQLVVGARNETVGGNIGQGAVYCYDRAANNVAFTQKGKILATGGIANDYFGTSVGINEAGNNVIIGASHFDYTTYTDSGAAFWVGFQSVAGTYSFAPNIIPKDPNDFDRFGSSVSFDENIIIISAVGDDNSSGMVSRLEFDDVSGTYASATFGNTGGTLSSEAQFTFDGTRGEVLFLSGAAPSTAMVTLDTAIDLGASWTISTWYKGLRAVGAGEWRTLTRGSSDHQIIVNDAGLLGVYDNAGGSGFASSTYDMDVLNNAVWHHIVAVGEGTTTTFYIDGVKVGNAVAEKPTDDIVVVGNYQGGTQRFSDYLDDFRVYSRALSQSEIRNITSGVGTAEASYGDTGSIYVWSTDAGAEVAKLYAPDAHNGDLLGWSVDVDIYTYGGIARMGGVIVASSIYNDEAATDGGAVYVWRSIGQQTGGTDNNGTNGNGTWRLEAKLTSFDTSANDYFGNDVAIDYEENASGLGGTRLLVGAPFEDANGAYSGAVYAFKHSSGSWLPEKYTDLTPQGGTLATSAFFGSSVAVAGVDATNFRAVMGSRWRDTGGQTNDGAMFWTNLYAQNYTTVLSAETMASESFFLPASGGEVVGVDVEGTLGNVSFNENGQLVYSAGAAFKSLGLGQTATDTFTYYTVRDGATYTNTVVVTVLGSQNSLTAVNDVAEVSATGTTRVNVLANDLSPDSSTLSILSVGSAGLQGSVQITDNGLVYDPGSAFVALRAGEKVQQTITYTARNEAGEEVTATVTLVVVGEDDPVVAVNDSVTTQANAPVVVDVLANDLDEDGSSTLSIGYIDISGARGSATLNADGTITYIPGDGFRYLAAGETAEDRIVYIVRDDTGNESAGLLTVLVIGVDDVPVANNDSVYVDPAVSEIIDVLANDVEPDGEVLHVTRVITTGTLGQVTLNANGTVSYTAPAGEITIDQFSYEVADALGNTSIATVYVNQGGGRPVDPALPVARDDVGTISGMESVLGSVTQNDDGATLIAVGAGTYGTVAIEDGQVRYTPNADLDTLPAGTVLKDVITYTVRHTDGRVATATMTLYINGTYVSSILDDEEDRFAMPTSSYDTASALAPVADSAKISVVAPQQDEVARQALDALIEMAAEEEAADAAEPLAAVKPVEIVKPVDVARPALSVMLGREALAKRAGVDALVRHFSEGNAA